jgi:nitrite reductase (NADH) small subunit/3-phenylpropionate/trans-cinnamate dioxygenase ferredoxin subunit
MAEFQTIAKVGDIPVGEGRSYPIQGRVIGIFHVQDGYRAINDFCPHMGASLSGGYVEGEAVMCPWHAWRFCLTDGTWLDSPNSKIRVECYELRVQGEDIQVLIPDRV